MRRLIGAVKALLFFVVLGVILVKCASSSIRNVLHNRAPHHVTVA